MRSALLTTRGGALRDLKDLDAAKRCARAAIDCDSGSPHPYNLLGAIHIQQGKTSEGEECLATAGRLGANMPEQRRMIEHALRSLNDAERTRIIQALLQLNPERYAEISRVRLRA